MVKFETVPVEQLKAYAGLPPEKLKVIETYQEYLKQLDAKTGGLITCDKGEDVKAVRADLRRAAKILGYNVTIKVSGNTLSVYLAEPRARRRGRPRKKK